jgi:ribosomal protein S18 acetylase RimI-like enzyme
MLRERRWDSNFFGRKIGDVILPPTRSTASIVTDIRRARAAGFAYLSCKVERFDVRLTQALLANGFYLADIGIIWQTPVVITPRGIRSAYTPRRAEEQDIPALRKIAGSLFIHSRFYQDPFFTRAEADRLFRQWTENAVRGEAANTVLHVPNAGFIACRLSGRKSGDIPLVGVTRKYRGTGIGASLVSAAIAWFQKNDVNTVTVRTQLRNTEAMNFYRSLGFSIKSHDVVFGKIL